MLRSKFKRANSFDRVLGGLYKYAGEYDIERAKATKMFNDMFEYDEDKKVVVPKKSDDSITVGESMHWVFADFNCYDWLGIDLSTLVTSNVKDMSSLFVGCHSLRELDLSNFDTSNVEDMTCMFNACEELRELDLRSFDTHNVKNMQGIFGCCAKLERLNLSSFVLSSVKDISRMFEGCYNLKEVILPKDTESRELVLKQLVQDTREFAQEIKLVQE